ncbi:ABC transporter substrate-binding protein [Clostridium cochlearium]|uniref:ABC transporter substrate-binding protein n=1 Tax=Clostridium cochlearium TaxID=1494 RepID=UPI0024202C6F|nr:ABC transporter substrate-binding protein [Clostridium cochlearium]MBE6065874.1 amino acid ABC transporter substrate-binding protein [Clostridium cochlearium]
MKKILSILGVFLLSTLLIVGCGSKNTADKENNKNEKNLSTLEKVKKEGVLKMGLNDTYPPMEFRDEKHNLVGFDVDLGEEIAKKLGVKLEIITNDWSGIILSLKSKKYDMILSTMSITDERKKEINFSEPYIVGGQKLVVKEDEKDIKTVEDLKGKIIGCQMGTTGEVSASKIEGIKELKKYDGVTQAFNDLAVGRINAVIADGQVGGYYLKKRGGDLVLLDVKLTSEPVGIGFRKEDTTLRDEVQKALDELKKEGTLSKLSEKWFGYDIYK